jgi:hypothetical protein
VGGGVTVPSFDSRRGATAAAAAALGSRSSMLTEGVLLFFTGERERELVGGRRDGRRKRGKDKVSDQRRELDRPL